MFGYCTAYLCTGRGRGVAFALLAAVASLVMMPTVQAARTADYLMLHGVEDGQTVSDQVVVSALASSGTRAVALTLTGPEGVVASVVRTESPYALVQHDGSREPGALDVSRLPEGAYTVLAERLTQPGGRVLTSTAVKFTVKHVFSAPAPAAATTTTSVTRFAASFDPSFTEYVLGGGVDIPLTTVGKADSKSNVVMVVWSDSQKQMLSSFAHTLWKQPWAVSHSKLNQLEPGRYQVQALSRDGNKIHTVSKRWITVRAAEQPVLSDATPKDTASKATVSAPPEVAPEVTPEVTPQVTTELTPEPAPTDVEQPIAEPSAEPVRATINEVKTAVNAEPVAEVVVEPKPEVVTEPIKEVVSQVVAPEPAPVRVDSFKLGFPSAMPTTYQLGSSKSIALDVTGKLPTDGFAVAVAWSDSQSAVVDAFGHGLKSPYVISADYLNKLPAGRTQLQVIVNLPGQPAVKQTHWIEVLPVPVPVDPFKLAFASSTPATYQLGSSQSIALDVSGKLPSDGRVVALAWSDSLSGMVDAFGQELSSPYTLTAAHLNKLPAGRTELQVLVHVPGQTSVKQTRWIEVLAAPTPPPATQPEPETTAPFTLAFASSTPTTYQLGSSKSIALDATGKLPKDGFAVAVAWSNSQSAMVDDFGHALTSPYVITAAQLNKLPVGRTQLQLLVNMPGQPRAKATHWIDIVSAPVTSPAPDVETTPTPETNPAPEPTPEPTPEKTPELAPAPVEPTQPEAQPEPSPLPSPGTGENTGFIARQPKTDRIVVAAGGDVAAALATGKDVVLKAGQRYTATDMLVLRSGQMLTTESGVRATLTVPGISVSNTKDAVVSGIEVGLAGKSLYVSNATGFLLEDCILRDGRPNITVNKSQGTIRRNVIIDARAASGGHGIFAENDATLVLIEQNVIDRNGHPTDGWQHNLYLHSGHVTLRENFITRAGTQAIRPGAMIHYVGNVFSRNPINITVNRWPSSVVNNLVLEGCNIGDNDGVLGPAIDVNLKRGWGIHVEGRMDLNDNRYLIKGNIVANRLKHTQGVPGIYTWADPNHLILESNAVYAWPGGLRDNQFSYGLRVNNAPTAMPVDATNLQSSAPYTDGGRTLGTFYNINVLKNAARNLSDAERTQYHNQFMDTLRARPRGVWYDKLDAIAVRNYVKQGMLMDPHHD